MNLVKENKKIYIDNISKIKKVILKLFLFFN